MVIKMGIMPQPKSPHFATIPSPPPVAIGISFSLQSPQHTVLLTKFGAMFTDRFAAFSVRWQYKVILHCCIITLHNYCIPLFDCNSCQLLSSNHLIVPEAYLVFLRVLVCTHCGGSAYTRFCSTIRWKSCTDDINDSKRAIWSMHPAREGAKFPVTIRSSRSDVQTLIQITSKICVPFKPSFILINHHPRHCLGIFYSISCKGDKL